jgi:4-hydroxy-2-oxoglutarate aldolase
MKRFAGIFTPIITPFSHDDTLNEPGLRANVARWMKTPLTGLVVLGSNGEAAQLDDTEADRVVDIVRAEVPRDRPLIAGTGRESTRATIAATKRAAAAGADAALVRTPAFFKSQMTTDVFVRHYTAVADASPIPVLLYNVTMFTGVSLAPDAVATLSAHPNIVGMKESGSDIGLIAEFIARTPTTSRCWLVPRRRWFTRCVRDATVRSWRWRRSCRRRASRCRRSCARDGWRRHGRCSAA